MANKNLSYFMELPHEEIIKIPAPETRTDEDGNRLELEERLLTSEQIQKIYDNYKSKNIAYDKRNKPLTAGNEVVFKSTTDSQRAFDHIIAEALVYPDLKNEELQKQFNCYDISMLPKKVFWRRGEYDYVFNHVLSAVGVIDGEENSSENDVETAKN